MPDQMSWRINCLEIALRRLYCKYTNMSNKDFENKVPSEIDRLFLAEVKL